MEPPQPELSSSNQSTIDLNSPAGDAENPQNSAENSSMSPDPSGSPRYPRATQLVSDGNSKAQSESKNSESDDKDNNEGGSPMKPP